MHLTKACRVSISTCRERHCFLASASSARASFSAAPPRLTCAHAASSYMMKGRTYIQVWKDNKTYTQPQLWGGLCKIELQTNLDSWINVIMHYLKRKRVLSFHSYRQALLVSIFSPLLAFSQGVKRRRVVMLPVWISGLAKQTAEQTPRPVCIHSCTALTHCKADKHSSCVRHLSVEVLPPPTLNTCVNPRNGFSVTGQTGLSWVFPSSAGN